MLRSDHAEKMRKEENDKSFTLEELRAFETGFGESLQDLLPSHSDAPRCYKDFLSEFIYASTRKQDGFKRPFPASRQQDGLGSPFPAYRYSSFGNSDYNSMLSMLPKNLTELKENAAAALTRIKANNKETFEGVTTHYDSDDGAPTRENIENARRAFQRAESIITRLEQAVDAGIHAIETSRAQSKLRTG